jgi:DNA-binding LacI/PurR family transcriptional regulator
MYDVAKVAGVSHQTVSRVLNGSEKVRPATRDRVLAAMRELDYRPNLSARQLVTGKSMTLGVVTWGTSLYGPASTLVGFERAAHDAGYFVSIVSLESLEAEAMRRAVERLRMTGVDAILVIASGAVGSSALLEIPRDLPVVAIEAGAEHGVSVVAVDQYSGARLATEHLLQAGHRTVHHLAGPPQWAESAHRLAGWQAAIRTAGAMGTVAARGDWSPQSGYELGERLLACDDVSAVFVANDQMALGLIRLLHERGIRVPEDVSIVGFDDIPEAEYFSPPLTTVRQDFAELGRRSLALLLEHLEEEQDRPASELVPTSLVVRGSVAAPRGR